MRLAHISHGEVVNLSVPPEGYLARSGEVLLPDASPVGIGWKHSGGNSFEPPEPPPTPVQPPAPGPKRRLTKLEFKYRFPSGKWRLLRVAAKTDEDLADFLEDVELATPDPDGTSIDLDDPRLIAGLGYLVSKNKLTQVEADAIRG